MMKPIRTTLKTFAGFSGVRPSVTRPTLFGIADKIRY
jgi:hypothetical protein